VTVRSTEGVLGTSLLVRGAISGAADLRLEGRFEGEIALDGRLVIGAAATVAGSVRGVSIEVLGEVLGPIAGQEVLLRPSARVEGDVRAIALTIDDGAVLGGLIEMSGDGSAS
jgi:cytoskeletal protein CcmA (bactofilin family)